MHIIVPNEYNNMHPAVHTYIYGLYMHTARFMDKREWRFGRLLTPSQVHLIAAVSPMHWVHVRCGSASILLL